MKNINSNKNKPQSIDTVVAHGQEMDRLIAAEWAWGEESLGTKTPAQRVHGESQSSIRMDRIDALKGLISTTKAESMEGCLIQLAVLGSQIDIAVNGTSEYHRAVAARHCQNLMYSMREILLQHCDDTLMNFSEYFMGQHTNPWLNPHVLESIAS